MKREEKLKEAFSNAAIEETEQLEQSLTYKEREKAEQLYNHHQNTALRIIRKQKVSYMKWVSVITATAAAILLIVWGMNRSAPDIITPAAEPVSTIIPMNTNEPQPTETETPALRTDVPATRLPALEARLVDFTRGHRYAVYTGPGKHYERANNNKAVVSTNDWIEVFGVENEYAMIQYAITITQRRIGYIEADALPADASVPALDFSYMPVIITQETELTDDPLGEKTPLHTVPAGAEAQWLAVMEDWAYLEWNEGEQAVRGFVPINSIRLKDIE